MSHNAPPSTTANIAAVHSNRQRMERAIDELAELSRTGIEPEFFFAEVLDRVWLTEGILSARLWRQPPSGSWDVVRQISTNSPSDSSAVSDVELFNDIARGQQLYSRVVPSLENGNTTESIRTLCPILHAGQTVGLLDTSHALDGKRPLPHEITPFLQALAEVTADFLSHAELQQLRKSRTQWLQWDQFTQQLIRANGLQHVSTLIVNDGRLVTECDRLTLLRRSGTRYQLLAMSGIERVESRSNMVLALESIAGDVARERAAVWLTVTSPEQPDQSNLTTSIRNYARSTGVKAIGALPIPVSISPVQIGRPRPEVVLIAEQFQQGIALSDWQTRTEELIRRFEPLLLAAVERDNIPFISLLQKSSRLGGWLRSPLLRLVVLAIAVVAILVFVPAEFTVTGPAELVPDHRHEIFASSSGIVDQLLVQHGDEVKAGQPLVVLHDPQLALEHPKIMGEIEVVRERLKSVQAARLAGGSTADSANRARQLTAEEEELKERQRSLKRQRELIEQQQAALTLRSPIQGKILSWDLATQLASRPVERGQALLSVGDTDGPWVIEMRVADKDFGHLSRARREMKPDLDVEFVLPADPGRSYRGTIREIAQVSQPDDQLGNSVLVTIGTDRQQLANPRAGTTAIPRIQCGKQALGYVWLHDLVDAVRSWFQF